VKTITFEQINERVAQHRAAEAARNAPKPAAIRAVYTLTSLLADLSTEDQTEVRRLLVDELASLDEQAWTQFGAALADR
jgi:hypothetical protein